jgi:hypothetical protein
MTEALHSIVTNEKLTRLTHWLVFAVGVTCLTASLAATALKVLQG